MRVGTEPGLAVHDLPASHRRGPGMKRLAVVMVAVLVGSTFAAWRGGHKLAEDEGRLSASGKAFVARPGKALKPAGKSRLLRSGDRVEIQTGDARIDLASGGKLEL